MVEIREHESGDEQSQQQPEAERSQQQPEAERSQQQQRPQAPSSGRSVQLAFIVCLKF